MAPDAFSAPVTTSVDPIADCAAQWRSELGDPVPPLTAYSTQNGAVVVRPASWPVPEGWRALPEGFRLDQAVLDLERTLGDQVHGLADACLDEAAATARTKDVLSRLALTGWRVDWRREFGGPADGRRLCSAYLGLDPEGRKVILAAERLSTKVLPFERMAILLRRETGCLDRAQALAAIRDAGNASGMAEGAAGYRIVELSGARSPCARITMTVGGSVAVQVSGGGP